METGRLPEPACHFPYNLILTQFVIPLLASGVQGPGLTARATNPAIKCCGVTRDYLTVDDVLDIHADQIEHYAGADGIRDLAGLQATVAMPQCGYCANILEEAAAL